MLPYKCTAAASNQLQVQVIKIRDANALFEHTLKSKVKYQFVIDMASLKEDA